MIRLEEEIFNAKNVLAVKVQHWFYAYGLVREMSVKIPLSDVNSFYFFLKFTLEKLV